MLKQNLALNRAERVSALGRIVFAVPTLLAALVDRPQPAAFAPYVVLLLQVYAAAAMVLVTVTWWRPLSSRPIGNWIHPIDLAAFAALVFLTDGVISPFFPLYLFAILSGTLRWDWRGAVGTSVAVIFLFIPTAFFDPVGLDKGQDDVLRFIVRIGQIVVVGGLLTYIGFRRERYWQELLRLARPVTVHSGSVAQAIDQCLVHVREFFQIPSAIFVWEMRDEPGWHAVRSGVGQPLPAISHNPAPSAGTGSTFDFRAGAQGCRRYDSDGDLTVMPQGLFDPAVAAAWHVDEAVVASIDSDSLDGWLVIPKQLREDDLYLARALSVQLVAALDNATASQRLQEAAASEERVRLAHDLHDSILQFLTGLSLQLHLIERQIGTDPSSVRHRIGTLQEALQREQQDLRRFLDDIRPRRASVEAGQSFAALVAALAREWDITIDRTISGEPPAAVAHQICLITREAIANAVRHGKASYMTVEGRLDSNGYTLTIADNGCGFSEAGVFTDTALRASNDGPRSIVDRIGLCGGTLLLATSSEGTRLQMTIPKQSGPQP